MNSPVPQKTSLVQRLDRRVIGSRPTRFVQAATVVAALSTLVPGGWMRIDPASFARLANFPVHDEHFLRDAGVFQIGIGLMMLGTLPYRDLSAVVLAGFVFTNTFHAINPRARPPHRRQRLRLVDVGTGLGPGRRRARGPPPPQPGRPARGDRSRAGSGRGSPPGEGALRSSRESEHSWTPHPRRKRRGCRISRLTESPRSTPSPVRSPTSRRRGRRRPPSARR